MGWIPDHIWYAQQAAKGKGNVASKFGGAGNGQTKGKGGKQNTKVVQDTLMKPKAKAGAQAMQGKVNQGVKQTYVPAAAKQTNTKGNARAEAEGREPVGNNFHMDTLLKRGRFNGWITPNNPGKFPGSVKRKLREMTAIRKSRAIEKGTQGKFDENVIYVRMSDVVSGVKLEPGMDVKFKVYVDTEGVGAYEVQDCACCHEDHGSAHSHGDGGDCHETHGTGHDCSRDHGNGGHADHGYGHGHGDGGDCHEDHGAGHDCSRDHGSARGGHGHWLGHN